MEKVSAQRWVIGGAITVLAYLAVVPLLFLLVQTFRSAKTGEWTLANYPHVFGDPLTFSLLGNSVIFATGTCLLAFGVGTLFAWLTERTNIPGKVLIFGLTLVPMIIPGILFTISWIFLASPRIGLLNHFFMQVLGFEKPLFNVLSMGGMIFVEGLHLSPMAFLMMVAAFRSMDPALEESALMSGASLWKTTYHVTLKLVRPAILAVILLVFVRAIESFEVPALLGVPQNIWVFTTQIFFALTENPKDIGLASTLAMVLILIAGVGIFLQTYFTREGERFQTISGKAFRPRTLDLGPWRWVGLFLVVLYFILLVLLPLSILIWVSTQGFYALPSAKSIANMTWENYANVFKFPAAGRSLVNTLVLAVASATLIMFLTAIISWVVHKTRARGRWLLDLVVFLPIVVPGVVMGVAIMLTYLYVPLPIYGSMWILLIAYSTKFMPYGMRYNSASMIQIHKDMEEGALMAGAGWWQVFRLITLPLLKPGLMAGWIYIFIFASRELSNSILLYSPGNEVLSIVTWELWNSGQLGELSALGVMMIGALSLLAVAMQLMSRRFGVRG